MDIGNLKNNYTFYEGYEGEPEIVLTLVEATEYNIHLWEGYFDDIFGEPILDGNGWKGFTRDMHQMEGVFGDDEIAEAIDASEYLEDIRSYRNRSFRYAESAMALTLIADFLQYAVDNNLTVTAEMT